jgi:hypothetical protein
MQAKQAPADSAVPAAWHVQAAKQSCAQSYTVHGRTQPYTVHGRTESYTMHGRTQSCGAVARISTSTYEIGPTMLYLRNLRTGAEVFLVGTAHVSRKSAEEVQERAL